jgi:hypothetical protein
MRGRKRFTSWQKRGDKWRAVKRKVTYENISLLQNTG